MVIRIPIEVAEDLMTSLYSLCEYFVDTRDEEIDKNALVYTQNRFEGLVKEWEDFTGNEVVWVDKEE